MRFLLPVFLFLAVSAFHSALSASLESAEKKEAVAQHDGLTELQKIDQMEFEAAQKAEATHMNVTEEQTDDTRYLEAAQHESVEERVEAENDSTAEGGGNADVAAREDSKSDSSEEAKNERQRREHHEAEGGTVSSVDDSGKDSTKEQDVLE